MTRAHLTLLALAAFTLPTQAQTPEDPANLTGEHIKAQSLADSLPLNHGAPALQQLLLKLRTRASLLMIVAHPDDEDGGLLTYESRGQGARVGMLTLTRGEGGQNLMTADFNDALGLIRTQELLAADRYLGVDQMFGTEIDFGFSKTKEESFGQWTHDRVLYDAVRAVRLYRPLVLASVFLGGVTDGHGHHQVAGEITQEVFLAAADPTVFPDQNLPPWAPLAVYARVPFSRVTPEGMYDYATGKTLPPYFHNYITGVDTTTPPKATVTLHEGDPATIDHRPSLAMEGKTYVQFARQGLALQKTQIGSGARLAPAGQFDVGYTLMAARCAGETTVSPRCPILAPVSPSIGWGIERSSTTPAHTKPAPGLSQNTGLFQDTGLFQNPGLFQNIDTTLQAIATLAPDASPNIKAVLQTNLTALDQNIAQAQAAFDPAHPEKIAHTLREALNGLNSLLANLETIKPESLPPNQRFNLLHELRLKQVQLNNALVLSLGLTLQAEITTNPKKTPILTTDRFTSIAVTLTNPASAAITIHRVAILGPGGEATPPGLQDQLKTGAAKLFPLGVDSRSGTPATRPYFSRQDAKQPFYTLIDPALRNAPATPDPLVATAMVDFEGVPLELQTVVPDAQSLQLERLPAPVRTNSAGIGIALLEPASVIPPVSLRLLQTAVPTVVHFVHGDTLNKNGLSTGAVGILAAGRQGLTLSPILTRESQFGSPIGQGAGTLNQNAFNLTAPAGLGISPPQPDNAYGQTFNISADKSQPGESYLIRATANYQGLDYHESFRPIGYPGLTYTNLYTPATFKAITVDVQTAPDLKIAYLPGTGDDVPAYLHNLGVTPTLLTPKDLLEQTLGQYDAIVLGVRAYNAHPELAGAPSAALLAYAQAGGVVIAQYNTGNLPAAATPYPLEIPGDPAHNVVVEAQPVQILIPEAPALNFPNRITAEDFNHWSEERGHGFPESWDPHYQALLETHDPDQDLQRGGLLIARTGKGLYVYCALALYRQLPEGVPGAYRLLANLLSLGKNPAYANQSK